jgi:exosome complex component CSL4
MDAAPPPSAEEFVTPGQRLGHEDEFASGPGTYVRGQHVFASLVGYRQLRPPETEV